MRNLHHNSLQEIHVTHSQRPKDIGSRLLWNHGTYLPNYMMTHPARQYVHVRFEVFMAVTMKNAVFWDVAPCRYCANNVSSHLLMLVPHSQIFITWRWRRYVPLKRWFTQYLHSATSQKMAFFSNVHIHQCKNLKFHINYDYRNKWVYHTIKMKAKRRLKIYELYPAIRCT
jgi:hypothetical protein